MLFIQPLPQWWAFIFLFFSLSTPNNVAVTTLAQIFDPLSFRSFLPEGGCTKYGRRECFWTNPLNLRPRFTCLQLCELKQETSLLYLMVLGTENKIMLAYPFTWCLRQWRMAITTISIPENSGA